MKISELRKVSYPPEKRISDPLFVRYIVRFFSIYFTRLFISAGIPANAVTLMDIIISCTGAVLLAFPELNINLAGIALLHLGYVLDCSDGELARYYKKPSLRGMFLDLYSHYLIFPFLFFAYGFHLFTVTDKLFFIIAAMPAGLTVMGIAKRVSLRTAEFMIAGMEKKTYTPFISDLKAALEKHKIKEPPAFKGKPRKKQALNIIRVLDREIFRHHTFLLIFTALIFSEYFFGPFLSGLVFGFLCVTVLLREFAFAVQQYKGNGPEKEFLEEIILVRKGLIKLD